MNAAGRLDWKLDGGSGWKQGPTFGSGQLEALMGLAQSLVDATDVRQMRVVALPKGDKPFIAWTFTVDGGWRLAR